MPITTMSSREFDKSASDATRATTNGPVFITERGPPAYVMLSFENYQLLIKQRHNIADVLATQDSADILFEPERASIQIRPVSFS